MNRGQMKLSDAEMGYAVLSVAVKDEWCFRGDTFVDNLPSYQAIAKAQLDKCLSLLHSEELRERIASGLAEMCDFACTEVAGKDHCGKRICKKSPLDCRMIEEYTDQIISRIQEEK